MRAELLREITLEEIRTYEEEGVVWLKQIIDPEWAKQVGENGIQLTADPKGSAVDFTNLGLVANAPKEVEGFHARSVWVEPEVSWGSRQQLHGTVLTEAAEVPKEVKRGHYLSMTGVWREHPFFADLALRSPLPEIAGTLTRSAKVNLYDDQLLIKPPMTLEKTSWHHDLSYDHIEGTQVCGIRVPASAETFEMGPVRYWRGSHRTGKLYKVNFFISDNYAKDDPGEPYPDLEQRASEFDIVFFTPEPGDVVVHHLAMVHGAGGNLTKNRTRCGITVRYGGDDVVYKFRKWAPPQDPSTLEDGDPLDLEPERFPRVLPRAARIRRVLSSY